MVLIASGLTAIIALTLSSVFSSSYKNLAYVSAKTDYNELVGEVTRLVHDSRYCKLAFRTGDAASPSSALFTGTGDYLSMLMQVIQDQKIVIAREGDKVGQYLTIERLYLEHQRDVSGNVIPPKVDSPSLGKTTHYVNLNLVIRNTAEAGPDIMSNKRNPISLTLVTASNSGEIVDCADSATGVHWIKSFTNPTFPLDVDLPGGNSKLLVMITAFHAIQLPGDMGRTVGSRYSFAAASGSGQFAQLEVGAGNNNGAQARHSGTTSGVISIQPSDTKVTLSRQGFILNHTGSPAGGSSAYSTQSIVIMGF